MNGDEYIRQLVQYIRANEASLACAMEVSLQRSEIEGKKMLFFMGFYHWMNDGMTVLRSRTLCLTPHYLFYLLSRFNEMELSTGPMIFLITHLSLNISHNKIESLCSLMQHPLLTITTIDIRSNSLRSLLGIEKLTSLERLDVRDNLLSDPMEIARLANAPNFKQIWVAGNPFTQKHFSTYRVTIFNLFRTMSNHMSDILIDGQGPGIMEKRRLFERVRKRKHSPSNSEKISFYSSGVDCKMISPDQNMMH
ncbi:hypothetical protein PCK1_000963 [Pneumocystis canis]|nr:hypothetical protein PCK1_000963 [Pneumocystis canis]